MLPSGKERLIEIEHAIEAIRDLPLGSLYKLRDFIDYLIFCDGTIELSQSAEDAEKIQ